MFLTDVPNLKEIDSQEGYFHVVQNVLEAVQRRKMWRKLDDFYEHNYITHTTDPISFIFDMLGHVYDRA